MDPIITIIVMLLCITIMLMCAVCIIEKCRVTLEEVKELLLKQSEED